MNMRPLTFLLLVAPFAAVAQRPTAEVAQPAESFWPLDARTGAVVFVAPMSRPSVPALAQAEHVRAWLSQACGTSWSELASGADSVQLYQGQLRGVHAGVELRFALRVNRHAGGWQYQLFACEVRSPTGSEVVHWLPLHRLLDDPDFRPDVLSFQQQLQRALPGL
jgi:hypothetical protein